MKTTAEKSSHTSSATLNRKPEKSFFGKAGGGDFFSPASHSASPSVQTKLAVNTPGDKYEVEADRVADKVMRMAGTGKHGREKDLESQQKISIQRKETNSSTAGEEHNNQTNDRNDSVTSARTEATIRNKTSGGQPLPADARSFMEPRFGNDFSNVRIHQDQGAAQLSDQLNAKAFTYGNHIFFGAGQFQPQSQQGKQLLAHELTHVVQQGAANGPVQNSEKTNNTGESTLQRQTIQTGSSGIQRGLLDDIKQGASAVTGALGEIINNVRQSIGGGITAATTWIRNIASGIGSGIVEAWTFIRNVATNIRLGVAAAWTFIRGIASGIGQAVTSAWTWIRGLATRINMGITNSWTWIQSAAARIGKGITASWNWIQAVASRVAQNITNSWNLIQSMASRLAMAITNAWNWIQDVASNLAGSITSAWNWIQATAARLGQHLPASWGWVKMLASRLAMGITVAWNWVQAVASGMAMRITNAWNRIQQIASRIVQNITNAWNWIQSVARNLAQAITNAWNWVQAAASRLAMAITNAWNWIQTMARLVGLVIIKAWNLIVATARKLFIQAITEAWRWIQTFARKLSMIITKAIDWVIAMALRIVKGIINAWNWLVNLARKLVKTLLEAWDWYWHAPDIEISTALDAADGSGKSRKKVGVGELVTFKGSKTGDWTASGGSPLTSVGTPTFDWTAPIRGTSATISLTSGKYTRSVIISVLEPNQIKGVKNDEKKYPKGFLGAFMRLRLHYYPKSVSFGNVESKEVSGPASNIQGYFVGRTGPFQHHDSGDTFLAIQNNNEDSILDKAGFWGSPKPWKEGRYDWVIPNHFKVKTEGGDGKKFTEVTQAHIIEGTNGAATVTKAGAKVDRTP